MATLISTCLFFVLVFIQIVVLVSKSSDDTIALKSLQAIWQNTPPSWVGSDPCGDGWEGIKCINSRVSSITLASMNLTGQLSGDLQTLSELKILDLSYNKGLTGTIPRTIGNLKKLTDLILIGCGFSGPIPDTIGSLQNLVSLSLNSNSFSGSIPPSIGNLSNLYWLDLADNQLDGPIPVSNGSTLGLDMLLHTKHFHLGQNKLSGTIPQKLFSSNMHLIHVLFDGNNLTGSIPSSLGLVQTLEVVRFDRNFFSGPVPSNLNNLISVNELYLSNNRLTGPMPDLTGMNLLNYVDVSNNSFDESDVPSWASTLVSLTTIMMEHTRCQGQVPPTLFSLPHLQTVSLKNNQLNGTLDIGDNNSDQLQLIDLQTNFITEFEQRGGGYNATVILVGNPVCVGALEQSYCTISKSNKPYFTQQDNCVQVTCPSDQVSSPNCKCAYPYTGNLAFRAPSFSNLGNTTYYEDLEKSLLQFFRSPLLPVDSVSLSNPTKNLLGYLQLNLEFFPSGQDRFNRSGISDIGFALSNQTYKPPKSFGPFYFIGNTYANFAEGPPTTRSKKSLSKGIIIGAAAGVSVLLLLLLIVGLYAFRQRRLVDKATGQNSFAQWDSNKNSGGYPQLKGARWFSFDELKKCTNNFSEASNIGSGGYGKVYRGALPNGQLTAIKRAQQGSMQGALEFKTEIELLTRVHHKHLVSLLGFCFEQGEQILVYEYVPNGTLKESLSGKTGVSLDWTRRLRVALGAARGVAYLHELADPPIIHRDIKSTNILLDERLNAKVADFGLSKLMSNSDKDHVSTQVKGTMGYLDPEYYMSNQLTEKSDVYSFGVLMLELITAKKPIERGQYIVRVVRLKIDRTKDLYNLHEILDPAIGLGTPLKGLERFVDLAMRCVEELGVDRPMMSEVVKEIESIMQLAGLNPNAESASTSASYEKSGKADPDHPYESDSFDYSGAVLSSKIDPK